MKKVRTSDEIQSEINRLEWELKELREELYASNAINNPSYDEYKNKWVFYDAYENGWHNGEGWDIYINDTHISLTSGQLDAINYLIKSLDLSK